MSQILSRINHPHDLKNLTLAELEQVAAEIRQTIMDVVDRNGGHLASNLGSVEMTLALHKVYDFPHDRLVWDVSHQTYPHKLVTGRRDRFDTLRTYGGISGFCNKRESIFDLFDAGHAGTSISLALGVAAGDYHLGERHRKTIAVVGDAAIAAGMAFEALNHAGEIKRDLMVILNDNRMSIANSVGALSMYLNRIRSKPIYQDLKRDLHELLSRIPVVGKRMDEALEHLLEMVKHSFVPGLLFQELGFNYFGPVNGHNLEELIQTFEDLRKIEEPVLLHVLTVKGYGYDPASKDPIKYHAPKNFKPANNGGKEVKKGTALQPPQPPQYTQVFSDILLETARKDRRILAITAAMPGGTGLTEFAKEFPERYFDVGIAEQHGAAFSSGLAYAGARPVYAVYSTFCQRAYDQFVHDVCIQENSVIFCLDRAGLVGEDGWTHHGVFDISYMRCIPNVILMAPRDGEEFKRMFRFAVDQTNRAVAIRYPRSIVPVSLPPAIDGGEILLGKGEILAEGEEVALLGYGSMVEICWQAAQELRARGHEVTVANARFAKPIDLDLLRHLAKRHSILLTAEEHVLNGGFGSMILEAVNDHDLPFGKIVRLGVPDRFITFGARNKLLAETGLDVQAVVQTVERLLAEREPPAPSRLRPDLLPADRPTKLN